MNVERLQIELSHWLQLKLCYHLKKRTQFCLIFTDIIASIIMEKNIQKYFQMKYAKKELIRENTSISFTLLNILSEMRTRIME